MLAAVLRTLNVLQTTIVVPLPLLYTLPIWLPVEKQPAAPILAQVAQWLSVLEEVAQL
jgi:hypothetical protein